MPTSVTALLQLAVTLLAMVSATPNVDTALRDQATTVAEQAIEQATIYLSASSTPAADKPVVVDTASAAISKPIEIFDVVTMTGATTSRIRWSTSEPTYSKVIFNRATTTLSEFPSVIGKSTIHIVDFPTLPEGKSFDFEIEAGEGKNVARQVGQITTQIIR